MAINARKYSQYEFLDENINNFLQFLFLFSARKRQ